MPSLTMQSIGVAGGLLASAQQNGPAARSSQAGAQAGLQAAQNQLRATASATEAKSGKERSIQAEKRPEGVFSDESESNENQERDNLQKPRSGFTRVA